jgi:hypothetical protein
MRIGGLRSIGLSHLFCLTGEPVELWEQGQVIVPTRAARKTDVCLGPHDYSTIKRASRCDKRAVL